MKMKELFQWNELDGNKWILILGVWDKQALNKTHQILMNYEPFLNHAVYTVDILLW